ncbi:MAG: hypothetical protein VKS61_05265 [Candidatus Sericytochromatia bacterium]|nr:hypothetical protein [Candidatus Sericytochromatia bacterium]
MHGLKGYQRNAHDFGNLAKDFREEFHGHTDLRDETRRCSGPEAHGRPSGFRLRATRPGASP